MPATEKARADFERNIAEYSDYWAPQVRWRRSRSYAAQTKIKRFRSMLEARNVSRENLRVFDQGFGLGEMLFAFEPSCSIAGLEISQSAVDAAAEEAAGKGFKQVDLRLYVPGEPYPAEWHGSFDIVISSHVLEHIQDPKPALGELVKLLKPGGTACVVVPVNEKPGEDLNHFHLFTPDSFSRLLEEGGLKVEQIYAVDRLWHILSPVFYRRQRNPKGFWRLAAILQNAVFGPMPHWGLAAADRVLSLAGIPQRQCFAWCRK